MEQQQTVLPWLRKIILTLGPVEEWKGAATGGGDVIRLVSDGTPNSFAIVCSVNKTVMGTPNPSTVSIHNLSTDTRNAIRKSLTKVIIEAGWENTEMHTVFQGSVISTISERSGPDMVTKISAAPGYGALVRGTTSKTYAQGMAVRDVVKDLGSHLPGVTVDEAMIKEVTGSISKGGWSFSGATKEALTELSNEYGFSWSIDNGALKAVGDKASFNGIVVLEGGQGGLISVSPALSGPTQKREGVKIKALYVPGVEAGATVRVKSALSNGLDGDYRINTAAISLDTFSSGWTMDLDAFKAG